jgi:hypothetical protein
MLISDEFHCIRSFISPHLGEVVGGVESATIPPSTTLGRYQGDTRGMGKINEETWHNYTPEHMECLRCKHVDVVSRLLPELGSGDRLSPTAELNAK